MTLKQRVRKLETGGGGPTDLEGLPEALMGIDRASVELRQRLDNMTESELLAFALDGENDSRERKKALVRLKDSGIETERVTSELIKLLRASAANWRKQAGIQFGHERRLCEGLARMNEQMIKELQNETEAH